MEVGNEHAFIHAMLNKVTKHPSKVKRLVHPVHCVALSLAVEKLLSYLKYVAI